MDEAHARTMSMRLLLVLAAAASLCAPAALAQEVITSGDAGAPPSARTSAAGPAELGDPQQSPAAIGAWARDVLAGRPSRETQLAAGEAPPPGRCAPPPDRAPHGEVWAGVGTRGYRQAGGVVTMPVGDCGHLSIAIDKTEFDGRRHR